MHYRANVINFFKSVANELNIEGSMYEISKSMKDDIYNPSEELCVKIINFLESENIEKLNQNVYKMIHPDVSLDDITLDELNSVTLNDLNSSQLINYLGLLFYGITFQENGNLLLLKYNKCIYNTGWFKFALNCRGIVLDKNTLEIVGYPFDKFFNINERPEFNEKEVLNRLNNAKSVSLTDKKDGSIISVFKYQDEVFISSNGSLSNIYIDWAKELFNEKYHHFINNVPDGYTFIFELVIPETRVIIDYGDIRKLYLIGIRDMSNYRFLDYHDMLNFANNWNLDITENEAFDSLNDLLVNARLSKKANKEGWVLKISNDSEDYFVKIKLEEYFVLHRMAAGISMRRVYNMYTLGTLNNFMLQATEQMKDNVVSLIEEIDIIRERYFNYVMDEAEKVLVDMNMSREDVFANSDNIVAIRKHINNGDVLIAIKDVNYFKNSIKRVSWNTFIRYQNIISN